MECTSIYYQYSTLFFLHAYTWLMSYYEITLIRMLHLFFHKITVFSQNIVGNIIVYDSENSFCNFLQTITILHIFSPSRGNKVKSPISVSIRLGHTLVGYITALEILESRCWSCYPHGCNNKLRTLPFPSKVDSCEFAQVIQVLFSGYQELWYLQQTLLRLNENIGP